MEEWSPMFDGLPLRMGAPPSFVMPRLGLGIHQFLLGKFVDGPREFQEIKSGQEARGDT
jgi:hypothetical protein